MCSGYGLSLIFGDSFGLKRSRILSESDVCRLRRFGRPGGG